MICGRIENLVKQSKYGDKEALAELVDIFEPLIRKYSRKLNYDGAREDLQLWLIRTVKHINM